MKKLAILLLSICNTTVNAQDTKLVSPDASKIIGTTHASSIFTVQCGGSANVQSVDLNWKPILTKKYTEIDNDAPDQKSIDSIKDAKQILKQALEKYNRHSAEKTTIITPHVASNFAGNTNNGSSPLDNNVAISNGGYIVSVTNEKIEYYNTGGTNLYSNSIAAFLPSTFGVSAVCDPVVYYDPGADRFILFCQQTPLVSGGMIFICFSKDNNPNDGWWCYELYGDPTPGNFDAFDYPKLAVNDSEVFLTGNLFSEPSGSFHQAVVFQMDKLSGLAGGALNYVYYVSIPGSPFTILPVSYGQDGDFTTGMLLVSNNPSGASGYNLYQIAGNWCCSPVLNYWSVTSPTYSPSGNSYQLGTSCLLKTGDCRALSGFYLNGLLHFVFNVDYGSGYTGIGYNRLDVSTLTNTGVSFGSIGYDYAYPSVASYATTATDNSVMIGFGRSGSSIYPEIRVVNCDNSAAFSGSTLVRPSSNYVSYTSTTAERWGDYSGISRKHNSTMADVWMSGSFGNASHLWDTWIAEIAVPVGINDINKTIKSKVFPNPVVDNFTVEFPLEDNENINISILDINGKVVKELYSGRGTSGENVFSFNKNNLSSGVYSLMITSNSRLIRNEKIVVGN